MRWLLLVLALLPVNAWAGAWLQAEGKGQVITNFNYYQATKAYNAAGNKVDMPTYTKLEVNPYVEYGLFDNLTIGGSFAYKVVTNETQGKTFYDSDDYNLFIRWLVFQGEKFVISAEPSLYLPRKTGGELNSEAGLAPMMKFNFGYGSDNYFVDASVGYQHWSNEESDRIRSSATAGYNLTDDFTLMAQVFSNNVINHDYTKGSNFDLSTAQVSLVWDQDESFSHQLGLYKDIYARNTGSGAGVLYSIWYKF